MDVKRFNNLVAFRLPSGEVFGFHPFRMEIAVLDDVAWNSFASSHSTDEARQELLSWSQEEAIAETSSNEFPVTEFSLNLSQVCDLHCSYCGAGGDGTYGSGTPRSNLELVEQQLRGFISRLKPHQSFRLQFLGGEPLLYPQDLKKISSTAKSIADEFEVNLSFSIITNGTRINREIAAFLGAEKFQVTLSFDGPREVQDEFRPTKTGGSSFDAVLSGLQHLQTVREQLSSLHVNAVMGIHQQEVVNSYEFLRQFNFDLYNFGFASAPNDEEASKVYIENMTRLAHLVYFDQGINGLAKILPFGRFLRSLEQQVPVRNFCGAGKSFIHSDTRGQLYACNWFSGHEAEKIGQVDQIDPQARGPWLNSLISRHGCQDCWAQTLCGGGCAFVFKTKTGTSERRDQLFCERIRSLAALSVHFFGVELSKNNRGGIHA